MTAQVITDLKCQLTQENFQQEVPVQGKHFSTGFTVVQLKTYIEQLKVLREASSIPAGEHCRYVKSSIIHQGSHPSPVLLLPAARRGWGWSWSCWRCAPATSPDSPDLLLACSKARDRLIHRFRSWLIFSFRRRTRNVHIACSFQLPKFLSWVTWNCGLHSSGAKLEEVLHIVGDRHGWEMQLQIVHFI